MVTKTEEEVGRELRENNEKIVHCLLELRAQRDDLLFLLQKQKDERKKLEMEMERLTYKLCLINKSMAQRMKAKQNYDSTIEEIEEKYKRLRENSGDLMLSVTKDCHQLDTMINKKTGTEEEMDAGADPTDSKDSKQSSEVSASSRDSPSLKSGSLQSDGSKESTPKVVRAKKDSHDDCACHTKEGKCGRERTATKMIQAAPTDAPDVPTKLEKEPTATADRKTGNQEKSAQTSVTGEPQGDDDTYNDDYDPDQEFEAQRSKLTQAATQYKETSLRRSL